MDKTIIDKGAIAEAVKAEIGSAFNEFAEKPDKPNSCSVGVREYIRESGWAGKWTEHIRKIVYDLSPDVRCVCVKPLQFREIAWYRIDVA